MIATMLSSHVDSFSRGSNQAGGPLPLIPRRGSSSRMVTSPTTPRPPYPIKITVQYPSPPNERRAPISFPRDSESSSSSSDGTRPTIAPRAKRVRGQRIALAVSASTNSASVPEVTDNTKATLLNIHAPKTTQDDSFIIPRASFSATLPLHNHASQEQPRMVRKKSGQPVKSSLKSSKSFLRGSLSVVMPSAPGSSKSEPSTPTTSKAVHFDAQLEHVKLFLAEQKPLAVSRDGSPTEDTSGTDTDFPSFIYGQGDGKVLSMHVTNMPDLRPNPHADASLESLVLSPDKTGITGYIRVRNIAFHKWLAVRFTFDAWQTTSEVTAKYVESIDDNRFDRFSFTIRLNDMLPRIDGRQMVLAVRYVVDGREIWDNNNGRNYVANFTTVKAERPTSDSKSSSSASGIGADLKSKLERVVAQNTSENGASSSSFLRRSASPPSATSTFKNGASLASRYDFGSSLKSNWKPNEAPSPPRHFRAQSHPLLRPNGVTSPSSPNGVRVTSPTSSMFSPIASIPHSSPSSSIPWPVQKGQAPQLGSPRDLSDMYVASPTAFRSVDDEDKRPFTPTEDRSRNHARGYFDLAVSSLGDSVKKTPPGTPKTNGAFSPRYHSFPPVSSGNGDSSMLDTVDFAKALELRTVASTISRVSSDSSELSASLAPSSLFSPISSRSSSPCSSGGEDVVVGSVGVDPSTDYHEFLDKFCFFTGAASGSSSSLDVPEELPRSHSASSVEGLIAQTPRTSELDVSDSGTPRPVRSASADDVQMHSGGSTLRAQSRSSTPVLV